MENIIEKIYNNKNMESRSEDMHTAEAILMEDLPVIPIVYNQSAYLINEDLLDLNNKVLFWDKASEYYYPVLFDKMSIKEYEDYEEKCAKFVIDNFETWKQDPTSYFGLTFKDLTVAEFVRTNSNYLYLFKNKDYSFIPEEPTGSKTEEPTEETTERETEAATEPESDTSATAEG